MTMLDRIYKIDEFYSEKFYQLPQILFTHTKYRSMSISAKVLYSVLRDRQELSIKNGWTDKEGNIFSIYKVEDLMELLNASKGSIISWKKELVEYGLIIDKRIGLQKCNRIYVLKIDTKTSITEDMKNIEKEIEKIEEIESVNVENSINQSKKEEKEIIEDKKIKENNIVNSEDIKKVKINPTFKEITINEVLEYEEFKEKLRKNLDFYSISDKYLKREFDELIELMSDACFMSGEKVKINENYYLPKKFAMIKFEKLRFEHIEMFLQDLKKVGKVNNMRNYLLTGLINCYSTYSQVLRNDINTDLFKVEEKTESTEENNENFMNLLEKY